MMTGTTPERPTIRVGSRTYPVLLPKLRDPRFKIAATVVSVHILGQVGLDFRLSIAQILAAVLTAMVLEIALLFRRKGAFEWPASALLTGDSFGYRFFDGDIRRGGWIFDDACFDDFIGIVRAYCGGDGSGGYVF